MAWLFILASVGGAFTAGLKGAGWWWIVPAAAIWAVGYFLHKPQALRQAEARGGLISLVIQIVVACMIPAAISYGIGTQFFRP